MGTADLPRCPLAENFLYVAIVPANACQHTKFQLSSSISFGDMSWVCKIGAPDFPRRSLADKFVYRALVHVNAYKCAIFQLPSSTSFRDKEGVLKFNVGATIACRTPYAETFVCAQRLSKVKHRAKFQHCSFMHHAVMRICISHRLMCPKILRVKM